MRFAISRMQNNHTHIAHKVPLAYTKCMARWICVFLRKMAANECFVYARFEAMAYMRQSMSGRRKPRRNIKWQ